MNSVTVLKRASINPPKACQVRRYEQYSNFNIVKDKYNDANEYQFPLRCFETLVGSKHNVYIRKR